MHGRQSQEKIRLMPSNSVDAIVLGAGFVGVSAALALQARGRKVALIDRHGKAAGETSFGNAGIIETMAVIPYVFPRPPASPAERSISIRAPISVTGRCLRSRRQSGAITRLRRRPERTPPPGRWP